MKKIITLVLVLTAYYSFSQINRSLNEKKSEYYLNKKGEVYFKFDVKEKLFLNELSRIISLDNIKKGEVYAYANRIEFGRFKKYCIDYEVLVPPGDMYNPAMSHNIKQILSWNVYPTYTAYESMMAQFETTKPNLCKIYNIKTLASGRKVLFAKISSNVNVKANKPQFMFSSTMHGDETTAFVLMLRLIDYLITNYGIDSRITNLLDNVEIWINPNQNPDGTYRSGNTSVNGATRGNANNVDLNRNFPDPHHGQHPDGNSWQPETMALMSFTDTMNFVLSMNFHGGAEVFNYPWDGIPALAADNNWWIRVGNMYADTVQAYGPIGYFTDPYTSGITNGYAWYEADGGKQDFLNYYRHCRDVTLEISGTKLVPQAQLPSFWNYNYRSFLNYMEQSLYGIRGIITDSLTGQPLRALVNVNNYDNDSSQVYSALPIGNYHRLLNQGTYSLTFSAPGYTSKTINNIQVSNNNSTVLNIALKSGITSNFYANTNIIAVGGSINFTDATIGNANSWSWTFEGGTPSTSNLQNPSNIIYNIAGNYLVTLTVTGANGSSTITKQAFIKVINPIENQNINMQTATIATCSGNFYDNGGASGNYSDSRDYTLTFIPSTQSSKLKIQFLSFNLEAEANCNYDWLQIYDGNSTSATLIGKYCGTNSPGIVTATNSFGSLTFQFHSDNATVASGWNATISCNSAPLSDFYADTTSIIEGQFLNFHDISTGNPTSWNWTFDGGTPNTSNLQNPQNIVYNTAGVYSVSLNSTNSFGSNTVTKTNYITVTPAVGINNFNNSEIKIYPNPVKDGYFIINSNENIDNIRILNIVGEVVSRLKDKNNKTQIDISNLNSGIYFIEIKMKNKIITKKINIIN